MHSNVLDLPSCTLYILTLLQLGGRVSWPESSWPDSMDIGSYILPTSRSAAQQRADTCGAPRIIMCIPSQHKSITICQQYPKPVEPISIFPHSNIISRSHTYATRPLSPEPTNRISCRLQLAKASKAANTNPSHPAQQAPTLEHEKN